MIEETTRAVVAEVSRIQLGPNDVLTITMQRDYTPHQISEIRAYVLAVIPDGVWVLVLPPSSISVIDVIGAEDDEDAARIVAEYDAAVSSGDVVVTRPPIEDCS